MKQGQRVTGHIANQTAGRVDFTGTVTDTYRSGRDTLVTVACDDGQERTAREENLTPEALVTEAHVMSILGGKVHLTDSGSPVPFPLCGSARRNTATKFRTVTAPVTCTECGGILRRRAARLAREAK
jgi:hypothetical protein